MNIFYKKLKKKKIFIIQKMINQNKNYNAVLIQIKFCEISITN